MAPRSTGPRQTPLVGEVTSLLGDPNQEEKDEIDEGLEQQHPIHCPTSAEVIEWTSVLFSPDFSRYEETEVHFHGERRNHVALSTASTNQRQPGALSNHLQVLAACGISERSRNSTTRFRNARNMIGTITRASILNLIVSTGTAGGIWIVILPGCFARLGWLEGTLVLILSWVASAASLFVLDWCCDAINAHGRENGNSHRRHNAPRNNSSIQNQPMDPHSHDGDGANFAIPSEATVSYASLVDHTLGWPGSKTLQVLTLIHSMGQLVAYLGVIGGQVVALVGMEILAVSSTTSMITTSIWIVALGIILPLSLLPEDACSLKRFGGLLGTLCAIYMAFLVMFGDGMCSLSSDSDSDSHISRMAFDWVTFLQILPIGLFAVNASLAYLPIRYHQQTCLGHALSSLVRWSSSTANIPQRASSFTVKTALAIVSGVYLVASWAASAAYCGTLPELFVDVWPREWIPGILARLFLVLELLILSVGTCVPLARATLWELLGCHEEEHPCCAIAKTGMGKAILTLGVVVSGAMGSLQLGGAVVWPLAITSAVSGMATLFVLPGLCAFCLLEESRTSGDDSEYNLQRDKLTVQGFVLMGSGLTILSLLALVGVFG